MIATSFRAWDVCVPVRADRTASPGLGELHFDRLPITLIELSTDCGLIGFGESARGTRREDLLQSLRALKGRCLLNMPVQEPDLRSERSHTYEMDESGDKRYSSNCPSEIGVHMALIDLLGKSAGRPASALFGGRVRDSVSVITWQSRMTPDDSAAAAKAAQADGAKGLRFECTLDDDVPRRAAAIREACGSEFKLTINPAGRFKTYRDAIHLLRELAVVGNVCCVEDPFPKDQMKDWGRLHDEGLFSIAIHVGFGKCLSKAIRKRVCDRVSLAAHPFDVVQAAAMCRAAKIPCGHGSGVELGVAEAMHLHTAAACRAMTLPSDLFGRTLREHNLIVDPLQPRDGQILVPTGPGIGVELDRNAVDKYCISEFSGEI